MDNNQKEPWVGVKFKKSVIERGLHSTEEAFLLPTQQQQVQSWDPLKFFSHYCLIYGQFCDETHLVQYNGFLKCSEAVTSRAKYCKKVSRLSIMSKGVKVTSHPQEPK